MTDQAKLKAALEASKLAMAHANEAELAADAAWEALAEAVGLLEELLGSEGGEPEPAASRAALRGHDK